MPDRLAFAHDPVPGLVSVVWPSRRRVRMAAEALAGLAGLASGAVEYAVAYDPDDPGTGEWARYWGFATWEAPERLGWAGHGTYTGRLWELARGEWVLCWGDDGRMLTPGWDNQIRALPPGVAFLNGHPWRHNVFPAAHRAVLAAIGEVLPSPHVDTWLTDVARAAGCLWPTGVTIREDRFDLTGNNDDEVWRQGSVHAYRAEEYLSAPMGAIRARHAAAVAAALREGV